MILITPSNKLKTTPSHGRMTIMFTMITTEIVLLPAKRLKLLLRVIPMPGKTTKWVQNCCRRMGKWK